jgi:signal transduction histidine kinase
VERQVYRFLGATLIAILITGLYLIRSNRQLFAQVAALSEQRSELARELIATQESTLRYISRELHDEFGQVLTAIGAMLTRSTKEVPEGSALRADLQELRGIAQTTLDKVRTLSQALHPVMLDEAGLESTLDWYLTAIERQAGIKIRYEKSETPIAINGNGAIHIYRILQEALNNVIRHAGTSEAWVRVRSTPNAWEFEVEDRGPGLTPRAAKAGMGLVAMRERSELLGGSVEFLKPPAGGTLVRLKVPRENAEAHGE